MINILQLNQNQLQELEGLFQVAQVSLQNQTYEQRLSFFMRKLNTYVMGLPFMKELMLPQPTPELIKTFVTNDDRGLTAKVLNKNGGSPNDPVYGQMACPGELRPTLAQEITKKVTSAISSARQKWRQFIAPVQQRNQHVVIPNNLNDKFELVLQKQGFKRHEGDLLKCPPMGYIPEPSKINFYIRETGKNEFEIIINPKKQSLEKAHHQQAVAWQNHINIMFGRTREMSGEEKRAKEFELFKTVGIFKTMQPDFYLKDTGKGTFIELYGVQRDGNTAYQLKKKEKEAVYKTFRDRYGINYKGYTEGDVSEMYDQLIVNNLVLAQKNTTKINSWYPSKLFTLAFLTD